MRRAAVLGLLLATSACGSSGAGGTDGSASCSTCFVHGQWRIDNLSPCIVEDGAGQVTGATSSFLSQGVAMCPTDPTTKPTESWATDTLTVDCPGHYNLCLALKAGDYGNPLATDCTIVQDCAAGDYTTAATPQAWTPLGGWIAQGSAALACAQQFSDSGGYAELSTDGNATGCGAVSRVLGRVHYCPLSCNANPSGPGCQDCGAGSMGSF